jgi:hypothetical protein
MVALNVAAMLLQVIRGSLLLVLVEYGAWLAFVAADATDTAGS